jgi:hypothetical protein
MAGTAGCAKPQVQPQGLYERLQDPNPTVAATAAAEAGQQDDPKAVPYLVARLEDDDPSVRMAASQSLRRITGRQFGYRFYDDPSKRSAAVARWRAWLKRDWAQGPAGDANCP